MSKEFVERNKLIHARKYRDRKTYKEIANEFEISETRVRQILDHERYKRKKIKELSNKPIPEIDYICEKCNTSPTTKGRIYNALANAGLLFNNKWRRSNKKELMKIPNLGINSVNIILQASNLQSFSKN